MLIPKKQGGNKNKLPDWLDKRKIKKEAKKKDPLSEKTKNLISKYAKSSIKQVPYSYMCPGCAGSFKADALRKQIVEAARDGASYISCPKCGKALIIDRLIKVSTKLDSKINRNADLVSVYKNQGITPGYLNNSWTDRAILEHVAHSLGKFATFVGMFNPQIRFQRGVTRSSVKEGGPENIRSAEFSIEAVDNLDLRFRVLATAGITPAGKVVLPTVFSTLDGREIPFTKEAVADFLSGKLFAAAEPKISAPELHFKERDFTRFREVIASKKKTAMHVDDASIKEKESAKKILQQQSRGQFNVSLSYDEASALLDKCEHIDPEALTDDMFDVIYEYANKHSRASLSKKTAAGIPTPGQNIEYQGKIYTVDSTVGDASVLTDETGVKTAPIPNIDLNIQTTPGVVTTPGAVGPIPTTTLAEKVKNLIKRSLRDEKTLVPFTESEPDYSVAKQTDVDADFSVPYEKSNQGILPEEERAIQRMFRGGSNIKPVKVAGEDDEDDYDFNNGDQVILKPAYEEKKGEVFTLSQWDGRRGWIGDEQGRGWYVNGYQIELVEEEDEEENEEQSEETEKEASIKKTSIKKTSIKKTAEPTGYHETDETGKQIPISRLRTLINDYARAGQFPLDFDLTKVMSEVSRMTRKELEEILDKKLKNQHYPVVHAKKKTAGFPRDVGDFVEELLKQRKTISEIKRMVEEKFLDYRWDPWDFKELKEDIFFTGEASLKTAEKFISEGNRVSISPTKLNEILRSLYGVTFSEYSLKMKKLMNFIEEEVDTNLPDDIEDAINVWMEKTDQGRLIVGKKKTAEKYISEGDQVRTLGGLSGIVSGVISNYQFRSGTVGTGYSVVLNDGRINVFSLADLEKTAKRKISQGKLSSEIIQKVKANLTKEDVKGDIKDETEGEEKYDQMAKEVECPKAEKALKDMADDEADHAEKLEEVILPAVENTENYLEKYDSKKKSLRFAQEEEAEEKPKVEFKTLKTKPHKPELEVEEAVVATPEMQKVFHEIKDHEQRLDEIKAIVNSARQKVEEEIRKVQEEHGSVKEAEDMSQAIEKLAVLINEGEKRLVDLGEFFVWLNKEKKIKPFKASDRWKVEKLLEKFGKEAEDYLTRAERGAQSLSEEVQQCILTVFPKREGTIKKADVFDSIKELGSNLWNYVKSVSSFLVEGEDLGFVTE